MFAEHGFISPALALAATRIHWTIVHVILQLICALHALGLIVRSIADRIILVFIHSSDFWDFLLLG
jgi:hypothetical protein